MCVFQRAVRGEGLIAGYQFSTARWHCESDEFPELVNCCTGNNFYGSLFLEFTRYQEDRQSVSEFGPFGLQGCLPSDYSRK
jgi:hypothetical protein